MSTLKLIDLLKDDFRRRRHKENVLGVDVWISPLTLGEQATANAAYPHDSAMRLAEIIRLKCVDADGTPVFTPDDRIDLRDAIAGDHLAPIIAAVFGTAVERTPST